MKRNVLGGIIAGILALGMISSPIIMGNPESAKAFNFEATPTGKTKHITMIANETTVQVAPDNDLHPGGVNYNAYTFNGTIPGPTVGVDQGDNLTITLLNEGKLVHSLDFHAGIGPSQVLSGSVSPGGSKNWSLLAANGGSFLYHCGADGLVGVWEHIANGMYGPIIVHPQNEEQAKEFSVVYSELYNSADPGVFNEVNETGSFDLNQFLDEEPDLILTNGLAFKYVPELKGTETSLSLNPNATIFQVKPGEPTRWFLTNPGPNDGVAFHFISGQMDVRDGFNQQANSYGTVEMNDETWYVPAGSSSVFETIFPEEGVYVGVDHKMADVVKGGAIAVLATENATATDHPEGTWVAPKGSDYVGGNQQQDWVEEMQASGGTNQSGT